VERLAAAALVLFFASSTRMMATRVMASVEKTLELRRRILADPASGLEAACEWDAINQKSGQTSPLWVSLRVEEHGPTGWQSACPTTQTLRPPRYYRLSLHCLAGLSSLRLPVAGVRLLFRR